MSASRAKGTRAETAVVDYLRANGFPYAERRALGGSHDKGDIAGVPGWVIEVKDCKAKSPGAWLEEARQEAINARVDLYCTWVKKAGKASPGEWTVTMTVGVFLSAIDDGPVLPEWSNPVVLTGQQFVGLLADNRRKVA